MKNGIILLFVTFLIVCEICLYVNGKKSKNKVLKQQVILKDITTSIDKCVKNDKNIDKNEKAKFNICLTGLKKQKSTLAPKDKSTKIIFKKVIKDIIKCLKPKKSKTSNISQLLLEPDLKLSKCMKRRHGKDKKMGLCVF